MKHIGNFNNVNDYLPLLNAVLITDLFVIFLFTLAIVCAILCFLEVRKYNSNPPSTNTVSSLALIYAFACGAVLYFVIALIVVVKIKALNGASKC
jgi:hypothetical protein